MAQDGPREQRPPREHRGPREQRPPRPPRSAEDRNTVFIGNKPPMNYVLAVVTQFNGGSSEVHIRARGQAISAAVDVAEIVRNKFFQKAAVKDVKIGTEVVTSEDGRQRHVSAINSTLLHPDVSGGAPKPEAAPAPAAPAPAAPASHHT